MAVVPESDLQVAPHQRDPWGLPPPVREPIRAYCAQCRYGVSVAHPGECPMCRGSDWVNAD